MYQGGILKISLYENQNITWFHWDLSDLIQITDISTSSNIVDIENNQKPEFDYAIKLGNNGAAMFDYSMSFFLMGNEQSKLETIKMLTQSANGWCVVVYYYDGTNKFYNTPLFIDKSSIKMQKEMAYEISLKSRVPTTVSHLEYTPGVSTSGTYRADTTLLTADTTLYTADYDL